ncbi:phosphocholine cytidylyltransferase family protein [Patescibacteria group bacterium]|nr:phosphocholine cytidylyltransferase family protein [Patescibacteria group bacterium]MBU1673254.1 phosphocholine cytidylyltransferase family protein [Patescibacteria group bacterium]MBU1963515.1 phosphocholine cytidylyltransferase family protein [Patescibacteria group bacterium]
MQTIILAAGQGTRLAPLCDEIPKTLLALDDKTILEHIFNVCVNCGLYDFSIVTGHGHQAVDTFLTDYLIQRPDIRTELIYNGEYLKKGNIYSYYMTKEIFHDDDHVIINSDTIFHQSILEDLLNHPEKNVMAIDDEKELSEEEMKVLLCDQGKINKIHKSIDPGEAKGEYIGLMKLGREYASQIEEGLEKTMSEDDSLYYEDGLQKAIDLGLTIHPLSTKGRPAMEVDTHNDLVDAKEMIKDIRLS